MAQYEILAYFYDELMDDVNYKLWSDHIEEIFKYNNVSPNNILELACGTGNITIEMAKRGYDIVGLDISDEMLEVAYMKTVERGRDIRYISQDMTELDYSRKTDCVLCMCDGFNYITDKNSLKIVFEKVYELLDKNGIIVFDISSSYKIKNILGNNFMVDKRDEINSMWINTYDDETKLVEMDLTFFIKLDEVLDEEDYEKISSMSLGEESLYKKYEETHIQRAYDEDEIIDLLKEVGFSSINSFGDFSMSSPEDRCERIFFSAVKK